MTWIGFPAMPKLTFRLRPFQPLVVRLSKIEMSTQDQDPLSHSTYCKFATPLPDL